MLILSSMKEKNKKAKRKAKLISAKSKTARAVVSFFAVSGLALALMLYYLGSPAGGGRQVTLKIEPQSSTSDIAAALEDANLIHNAEYFKLYAHITGADRSLKSGKYFFQGTESLPQIIEKLKQGSPEVFSFTVPEGFTLDQIANLLESEEIVSREEFLSALSDSSLKFAYLPELPEGPNKLEGFLFPDTYSIGKGMTAQQIVQMMVDRFTDVYVPKYEQRAKEQGISIIEVITLASIIEREAKKPEERQLVSAVFHNRLKKGMLLQSCATVQYALGEVKPVLYDTDLQIDSPYNTYINLGLPPGPIAAPGEASIKAALFPADVSYLYFVAKPDGSHVFSNTLQEHNAAKRKYIS